MEVAGEKVRCAHCGHEYEYDHERRCLKCDGAVCPDCIADDPERFCPECRFGPLPYNLEPMLAYTGSMPDDLESWSFEYKWDGMRALCYLQAGKARLQSRNLREITALYPDLAAAAGEVPDTAIFDGEILAFDDRGRPDFRNLQGRMHVSPRKAARLASSAPVKYYVFDLLWLNGRSLMHEPLLERRVRLDELEPVNENWRTPAAHMGSGPAMLNVARELGLEGVMAKRADSPYRAGVRSRDWIKIKIVKRQELVIGGWEPRAGNKRQVGALLLGYYDPESLELRYAGRVGSGFDAFTHQMLVEKLIKREQEDSPFAGRVGKLETRFVSPELVAEVEYRRWPKGGRIQQASFIGLRDDVPAPDVVMEREE